MNKNNLFYNDLKPIDKLTDYGKGISFKSVDGREWNKLKLLIEPFMNH